MNMPGFTAEASLCKTSGYYRITAFTQTKGAVHPSLLPDGIFNYLGRSIPPHTPPSPYLWCSLLSGLCGLHIYG